MEEEKVKLVHGNIELAERGIARSTKVEVLTVDEVVEGYVGSLGYSQVLQLLLVSLAWMFDSQNTLVTIFTDAQPPAWQCKTPTTTNNNNTTYNYLCELNFTNTSSSSSSSSSSMRSVCALAPGTWELVGGNTSSTVVEWSLICDRKFLAALPASLFFLGSLLGSGVYGWFADSWLGRKRTVIVSCILTSTTALMTSASPNVWIYALLRFANGFARSGIGICCLVLSTEVVGRKWRGQAGQYGFFFFTAGFLSLPLIAYPTRNCWRDIYRIISIFPLLYSTLVLLPFVSESPRWLLVRGRSKEALRVLNKFATLNGKKLPPNLTLAPPALPINTNTNTNNAESLWTKPWAAKRMITVMLAGFGVGFVYYGVQLNVENLNFNLYYTVALNALMEIPAVFIGSFLLSFTNRRTLFSWSAYAAGLSSIICIVFTRRASTATDDDQYSTSSAGSWPQLTIEAISFMAASAAFDVLYVYCVELFPTNVRNFAVSLLRQALMLGASAAPLLVVLGRLTPSLSFLVFGLLSIFSGLLSLWLPETRNAPLYETLQQQEEEEKHISESLASGLENGK